MNPHDHLIISLMTTPFLYFNKAGSLTGKSLKYFNDGVAEFGNPNAQFGLKNFFDGFQVEPSSYQLLNNCAVSFAKIGYRHDAAKLFELGIKNFPRIPQIRYNYGYFLFLSENFKYARDQFEQAVSLAPEDFGSQNGLVVALLKNNELERAKLLLQRLINENSDLFVLYHNLGCITYYEKNFEESIRLFDLAIENVKDASLASTFNNRGCAYYCIGNFDEAVTDFSKAFHIGNAIQFVCYNFGFINLHVMKNDKEETTKIECCGNCSDCGDIFLEENLDAKCQEEAL